MLRNAQVGSRDPLHRNWPRLYTGQQILRCCRVAIPSALGHPSCNTYIRSSSNFGVWAPWEAYRSLLGVSLLRFIHPHGAYLDVLESKGSQQDNGQKEGQQWISELLYEKDETSCGNTIH